MSESNTKSRRAFLLGAGGLAAAAAGSLILSDKLGGEAQAQAPADPAAIRKAVLARYKTLGKTGLKVSSIGIGTASTTSPAVLERAIDLGINYVDTAHMYGGGSSEREVGKVMKRRRKDVVLTTKFSPKARTKKQLLASFDESMRRLGVEYVDCLLVHAVDKVERIINPAVFEAFDEIKRQGRARHLGFSGHGPNLQKVIEAALKEPRYEVVLIKYSYMSYPRLGALVDKMAAQGKGITVMKTRDGARHTELAEFQKGDGGFMGATLRWASSNPNVHSAVITTKTFADVDLFAKVAGQPLAMNDVEMLDRYAQRFDKVQCRWCGDCGDACPSAVEVWDVDRAAMYFERYGDERRGMDLYAALGHPAAACASCAAPCQSACDYKIPIKSQMQHAHELLSFSPPDTPYV